MFLVMALIFAVLTGLVFVIKLRTPGPGWGPVLFWIGFLSVCTWFFSFLYVIARAGS
jgi:hypothetical protein